jgi:hypothetical protein
VAMPGVAHRWTPHAPYYSLLAMGMGPPCIHGGLSSSGAHSAPYGTRMGSTPATAVLRWIETPAFQPGLLQDSR